MKRKDMRLGQRVLVPWGNVMAEATVVELIGTAARGYVRLAVDVPGLEDGDEPSIIPFLPEWIIEPAAA